MKKFKNVLFDLDGTLTDSSEGIIKSVRYAYDKLGLQCPADELLPTFIGPPLGDSFIRCGVPEERKEEAVSIFRERYNVVGKFENKPYTGMPELLSKLKDEGFKLYVATSKPEKTAMEVLEHFDMIKYFDEIAGATMDASRERKEDVIQYLINKINEGDNSSDLTMEDTGKTVMIGDTSFDVLGASEFDIPTICVSWGFGDKEDMMKNGALCIVDTMDELYGALKG